MAEKDSELVASLDAEGLEDDGVSRPCDILAPEGIFLYVVTRRDCSISEFTGTHDP